MLLPQSEPKNCPVCDTTVTTRFVKLRNVPVNCSASWRDPESARGAARGDIELAFCSRCGLIFNGAFDENKVEYSLTYDNSLAYSPTFRAYATRLAGYLVNTWELRDKQVVEVGCGKGDFLDELCRAGGNRGLGFDPSAAPRTEAGLPEIVSGTFTGTEVDADFVCCRHVLEHIEHPRVLLRSVRACLEKRGGSVYFEVPDARAVLDGPSTWDLIYPHCSYFTPASLHALFTSAGFEVKKIESTYGGQFLGLEAVVSDRPAAANSDAVKSLAVVARLAKKFSSKLQQDIFGWSRLLEYAAVEGRTVALWGAGAKGVTFLNVVPGADRIGAVVDLNPAKQGAFVPGTGQPVLAPESLVELRPDIVIVLNPLYEGEIGSQMSRLGLHPTIMLDPRLPIPESRMQSVAAAI